MQSSFDTPILMIMFNRPNHARRVFDSIKNVRPKFLFLAVDGPRPTRVDEFDAVMQCRQLVELVDWPCQVQTLFRETNLGCKQAVSSAISWFFEKVEFGIILEDDCLPDPTFFDYCSVLLEKYADDPKVMHIGGCNLYGGLTWGSHSYFITNIPHVWGWATWRRAWANYDISMREYPTFERSGRIEKIVSNPGSQAFWKKNLNDVYIGRIDTWDFQWVFTIWRCGGLCITPNQNLISNIGFDQAATHTLSDSEQANLPTIPIDIQSMSFPVQLELNNEASEYAFSHFYQLPSWWSGKLNTLRRLIVPKLID